MIYFTDEIMAGYLSNPGNGLKRLYELNPGGAYLLTGELLKSRKPSFTGRLKRPLVDVHVRGLVRRDYPGGYGLRMWEVVSRDASVAPLSVEGQRIAEGASAPRPVGEETAPVSAPAAQAGPDRDASDVVLLGCVKEKRSVRSPAKDLYTSDLFGKRRAYAEASGKRWFILSAKLGLVDPEEEVDPYDLRLDDLAAPERERWGRQVVRDLADQDYLGSLDGLAFEVHAGAAYREAIASPLSLAGARLVNPLQGLRFGEQLAWYGRRAIAPPAAALRNLRKRPGSCQWTMRPRPSPTSSRPRSSPAASTCRAESAPRRPAGRGCPRSSSSIGCAGSEPTGPAAGPASHWSWPSTGRVTRTAFGRRPQRSPTARIISQPWGALESAPGRGERRPARERSEPAPRPRLAGLLRVARSLSDAGLAPAIHRAVHDSTGSVKDLLRERHKAAPDGTPLFPMLRGPKIGPVWVRILAYPGGAALEGLEQLPVGVDVQVRKVTEYLGLTATQGWPLEEARPVIQSAWRQQVDEFGADAAGPLKDTCAALDPALWFFGKWGCTFCERAGRRLPVCPACAGCRYQEAGVQAGSIVPDAGFHPGDSAFAALPAQTRTRLTKLSGAVAGVQPDDVRSWTADVAALSREQELSSLLREVSEWAGAGRPCLYYVECRTAGIDLAEVESAFTAAKAKRDAPTRA